jgi:hypothetical protein
MPFTKKINTANLGRGLRPSKRMPRGSGFLIECSGAVGRDGVLQVMDELTRMATNTITDPFPYPQIFVFTKMIIVFGQTKVYEWVNSALVEKLTVSAGHTWSAVDFHHFIYASNGEVSIIRDPVTKLWSLSDQPVASAICNYNGQVFIGAPGV